MPKSNNNRTILGGKIKSQCTFSHEHHGEKFYEFFVESIRLSGTIDSIPIMISSKLMDPIDILIGKNIRISGQYRSYNMRKHGNVQNKQKMIVFAQSVELVEEEVKNLNNCMLNGFICKDVQYRKMSTGLEICELILAVNRAHHKSDYIPLILWGKNAEAASRLKVGDNLEVSGRIQRREYEKRINEKEIEVRVAYEVSVFNAKFKAKA